MPDLTTVYNAFDADEPLQASDTVRYVDLSAVRGGANLGRKLMLRVKNAAARRDRSHHLLMGHTKCGKTTELLRAAQLLEAEKFATVYFDIDEIAGRRFEYTTLLLIMVGQIIEKLGKRTPPIKLRPTSTDKLLTFLRERQVATGDEWSGDVTGKVEGKTGLLQRVLGELGLGLELRGGFQRSREITVKIEADPRGFVNAIHEIIDEARRKVMDSKHKGLVVICDGCDKLSLSAADDNGHIYDLQQALFVDHAADLRDVPCHVIYTVPISTPINFGDVWEQQIEFLPAVPVTRLRGADNMAAEERARHDETTAQGRALLTEVVTRRLAQQGVLLQELFENQQQLDLFIDVSGGHISDLILLMREAALQAQADDRAQILLHHVNRAIRNRAMEYMRLIEPRFGPMLAVIDELNAPPSNSNEYREIMFKRLALEYVFEDRNYVALHPLVAASETYLSLQRPL